MTSVAADGVRARQSWMRVLAEADAAALGVAWREWELKPAVEAIRGPEAGLVMVRGRIDGAGAPFNVGEATVSRATVRLHGGPLLEEVLGSAYVLGSDLEHAWLAAIVDGLALDDGQRDRVLAEIIEPLRRARARRDGADRADARSTLVDFFTVSREHKSRGGGPGSRLRRPDPRVTAQRLRQPARPPPAMRRRGGIRSAGEPSARSAENATVSTGHVTGRTAAPLHATAAASACG